VTLCQEFKIAPVTLRATLCGYANYKRYGGKQKVWSAYYAQYKTYLDDLRRTRLLGHFPSGEAV
jgi:predicted PolB exonuclease-like 3'-5' exonuclease